MKILILFHVLALVVVSMQLLPQVSCLGTGRRLDAAPAISEVTNKSVLSVHY